LEDIVEAIERISDYVGDYSQEEFQNDQNSIETCFLR
jgi:uncharacterized protein with HEPN domain